MAIARIAQRAGVMVVAGGVRRKAWLPMGDGVHADTSGEDPADGPVDGPALLNEPVVLYLAAVITGADVRRWRQAMGWSLVELARRINYSPSAINKWEHGAGAVPRQQYVRVVAAFFDAIQEQRRLAEQRQVVDAHSSVRIVHEDASHPAE